MSAFFPRLDRIPRSCMIWPMFAAALLLAPYALCATQHTRHGSGTAGGLTLATPSAYPYALSVTDGKQTVRVSVAVQSSAKQTPAPQVYLRRQGEQHGIAMNDMGVDGDFLAHDGIAGAYVQIDTRRIKPDSCLSYEAYSKSGRSVSTSPPLHVCVSSLPVGLALSNTREPVVYPDGAQAVADEILLYAAPDSSAATVRRLADSIGATVVGSILPLHLYQLRLPAAVSAERLLEMARRVQARAGQGRASPNLIGHGARDVNDPAFQLPATDVYGQHGLKLVLAHDEVTKANAWDAGGSGSGSGVTVVVLDTGLSSSHPDLDASWTCQDVPLSVSPPVPVVLTPCTDSAVGATPAGHGTEVAGIIAARANNALGVAGVAYGSAIHAIKLRDYTLAGMANGLITAAGYVGMNGSARIINASFSIEATPGSLLGAGIAPLCTAVNSAVSSGAGALLVNAVGNDNNRNALNAYSENFYPARCNDSSNVAHAGLVNKNRLITVSNSTSIVTSDCGSVAQEQRCATAIPPSDPALLKGSNYGAWVDIAAPGSAIRTTSISGTYTSATGTSYSAPLVAGGAAILAGCGVPLDQIETAMKSSATVHVPYPGSTAATATPRLDIYQALKQFNHPPTGITFTPVLLYEKTDTTTGYDVGGLTFSDPDTCDAHRYSIAGGTDAAKFSIGGVQADRLFLSDGRLNFLTQASYAVTVRVTDVFGATLDVPVTVHVLNVNDAPVGTNRTLGIDEDTTYTFSDLDFGFTDPYDLPPNHLSAVRIATLPARGTLQLGAMPVSAGQFIAAASLGALTYTPALHTYGSAYADFSFQVVDDGGTAQGGMDTDTTPKTLGIDVRRVLRPPTGSPSFTVARGGVPVTDGSRIIGDVLTADPTPVSNPDAWTVSAYQWRHIDSNNVLVNIAGAVGSTYTLAAPDYRQYMSVCLTYTDALTAPVTLCSGTDANAVGDPHITTVDGLHYDFQSAGEFVALRAASGLEIQTRHTPVATAAAITDPYSGLTSGVSINTAVAARVGRHRVSLQPDTSGAPASAGLLLRLDGVPTKLPEYGLNLGADGRLLPLPGGALQVDFPDHTTMLVTPGWWAAHQVWYLNVSVLHTSAYAGLMGARAAGSWLPRLADGASLGAMPVALQDRDVELYEKFAASWRVTARTSLFDYAPDTAPATYTQAAWPGRVPPDVATRAPARESAARRACRGVLGRNAHADCVFDVLVTGAGGFAQTYQLSQKIQAGLTLVSVHDDRRTAQDQETVTLTASVTRHAALDGHDLTQPTPVGTVQFTLDNAKLGRPLRLDAQGQARLRVARSALGDRVVGARYVPAQGSMFLPGSARDETLYLSKERSK